MQNYSTFLNQTTWGIHLNSEGHIASPPNPPSWLTQLQQQDWQQRGVILWDADHRIVTNLHAGYALELPGYLQWNDEWKTEGLVVGSPAFQLSSNSGNPAPIRHQGNKTLKRDKADLMSRRFQPAAKHSIGLNVTAGTKSKDGDMHDYWIIPSTLPGNPDHHKPSMPFAAWAARHASSVH